MYERFTDRARQALRFANEEATKRGHEYILPEHLLLGLIREGSGIGAAALNEVCDKADRLAEAINHTIENGTYQQVIDRWNLASETVESSEINPPGLPKTTS